MWHEEGAFNHSFLVSGDDCTGAQAVELDGVITEGLHSTVLTFTENKGQWDKRVAFRADVGAVIMFFSTDGVYYQFIRRVDRNAAQHDEKAPLRDQLDCKPDSIEMMMLKATFVGADSSLQMWGEGQVEHKCNYFVGDDPTRWRTDVPNYSMVTYKEVYPGIDLKYYGSDTKMEYDFVVSPGADISQIKIQYEGVKGIALNGEGDLVVKTMWGEVTEKRPLIYQARGGKRMTIEGRYRMLGDGAFGFSLSGDYDPAIPVVIDPVLSYSTYLGGGDYDLPMAITVDGNGSVYVTGSTFSTDFPTVDWYQTYQGHSDVFVTKLGANGSTLLYSTYLGGSAHEAGVDIAISPAGEVYLTGDTYSTNFPVYLSFDGSLGGQVDAFVTKLSSGGNSLIYSTYMGGSDGDWGRAIALNISGEAYITGITQSTDFPTQFPYQTDPGDGQMDAFVTQIASSGNTIVNSTYLGGNNDDWGRDIAVDDDGWAYITGTTQSDNFPRTSLDKFGFRDAFVTCLADNYIIYSTYLGGSGNDYSEAIAVDSSGNAYVTGYTESYDFFSASGGYQSSFQGGDYDAFVTRVEYLFGHLLSQHLSRRSRQRLGFRN